jgi:1-acyl-sn-glycerol-3-phosphate acyltransferase
VVIANHPSHADPAFLLASSPRPLLFLQARECYEVFLLRWLFRWVGCIPVARDGRDIAGLRLALRHLRQGAVVCLFPEGDVHPAGSQGITQFKGGAALLALRTGAPVIPAWIEGGPTTRHMLAAWLLPSRGVHVVFGPPVDLSAYRGRPITRQRLRQVTALLSERLNDLRPGIGKPAASSSCLAAASRQSA